MTDLLDIMIGYPTVPFVRHSETSMAAANAIEPDIKTLRGKVLEAIRDRGSEGATDEWLQQRLCMSANTERPRRRELQLAGLVKDSGQRRKTASGRAAAVWVAA